MPPSAPQRLPRPADLARRGAWALREAAGRFISNSDLRQASSLAFYSTLALIPAMFLLTILLSVGIGSSQGAMDRTAEIIHQVIPRFGEVILREVGGLASHPKATGALNLLVFTWSLTPLVSSLREIIGLMFKRRDHRTLLATYALDLVTGMAFITGLAAMAGVDLGLRFLAQLSAGIRPPVALALALSATLTVLLVGAVLFVFTPRVNLGHLLAGALTTAALWFMLRPAFTLFLTHDPGYGFAFGSFKSIFVVVIWIYYSMAALLFGAEVAAALHRSETVLIKRLMTGQGKVPFLGDTRLLLDAPAGWTFFHEGDAGAEMFYLLEGSVSIRQDGRQIALIGRSKFFGEMSFLLGMARSATVVALEPCRCVIIHSHNFEALLLEFPEIVRELLVEMAYRLTREQTDNPSVAIHPIP